MSLERVREYLIDFGLAERIQVLDCSSATVELAAQALGCCAGQRIAKTLAFDLEGGPLLVVAAGDAKIDNGKYKQQFGKKAAMLSPQAVEAQVGHAVGGVCPFALPPGVPVYLDQSLRRFDAVYPACGSSNSAIRLTLEELYQASGALGWVNVCKGWE